MLWLGGCAVRSCWFLSRSSATSRRKREFSTSNSITRSSIHLSIEPSTFGFPKDIWCPLNGRILHKTEREAWEQQAPPPHSRSLYSPPACAVLCIQADSYSSPCSCCQRIQRRLMTLSRSVERMYGFVSERLLCFRACVEAYRP